MKAEKAMHKPRFSIVIPTRERAETLRFAIQTCLVQNFDNYEVVICDNCSSPATAAVVNSFGSPRIVYHRSPEPLSMRDNWNLAYSLTRGEYIAFIGDDDGLMPYAFFQLDALIRRYGAKAIRWDCAVYSWPNVARKDLADYLQLCMSRRLTVFDGRQAIHDVMAAKLSAPHLPNVYHGLVAREVLEEIRGRAGHVFGSYHCDTYSSFAVPYLVDRYLSLTTPMSTSGFSASSNNIAFNFMRSKHSNTQRLRDDNHATGLRLNPTVPDLPTGWSVIADSFLTAKRELFPNDSSLTLDRKLLTDLLFEKMPIDEISEWPLAVGELRRSLSDDPELVAWFDERLKQVIPKTNPRDSYRPPSFEGVAGNYLHLDTSKYRVRDVAAATKLATRILGYGSKPIEWDREDAREAGSVEKFFSNARLALILGYHRNCLRRPAPTA